ncbi:MAG: hypothetical protein KY476_17410 [Planctomycetes bacterium]|nr:hypothetical protein [Planctomycetota bacterium]
MQDPILEELYEIREQIMEECGDDFDVLMDQLQHVRERYPDRIVTLEQMRERYPEKFKNHPTFVEPAEVASANSSASP